MRSGVIYSAKIINPKQITTASIPATFRSAV